MPASMPEHAVAQLEKCWRDVALNVFVKFAQGSAEDKKEREEEVRVVHSMSCMFLETAIEAEGFGFSHFINEIICLERCIPMTLLLVTSSTEK